MAKVLSKIEIEDEHLKGWAKFLISVETIYKKAKDSRIKRSTMTMVVPEADLACKCPKIKINK